MPLEAMEPGSPEDWLRHAESDLELSRMKGSPIILFEELCFHTQQTAEKSLKAVLIYHRIPFPKTHNIRLLSELISGNFADPSLFNKISILTDYALAARYPGNYEEISETEYQEAVSLAEQTFKWAKNIVYQ